MPKGFELIRARRRMGRWLDLHWIRKSASGTFSVIKLVEQDGGQEWSENLADAREVNIGTAEKPVLARAAMRTVPYDHVYMSWRQGGTRFVMTAAEVTWDEALKIAGSMQRVQEPQTVHVASHNANGATTTGEPSEIPTAPETSASAEVRPTEPVPGEAPTGQAPVETQQPPMMPEMADESGKELAGPMR
jgi:hypothetical protein